MTALEQYFGGLSDKRVGVIGAGVSNMPLISMLRAAGIKVTVHDKKTPDELGDQYATLSTLGVDFVLGDHYLDVFRPVNHADGRTGCTKRVTDCLANACRATGDDGDFSCKVHVRILLYASALSVSRRNARLWLQSMIACLREQSNRTCSAVCRLAVAPSSKQRIVGNRQEELSFVNLFC